jgi:mycobactin lysine-N-oxygenase
MSTAKSANKSTKQSCEPVQVAVVGGGPKAAAIAAKAWVLREQNIADIRVTIFEPEHIGAYWSGKSGYTDGQQRLCTIAERDVGYPYNSMFGRDVDVAMSSKFSWGRFLHTRPSGYETGYSTWVDAGRKPPLHKHFAAYLQWIVAESSSQVQLVKQRVTRLAVDGKDWQVDTMDQKGIGSTHSARFDATVVTGPGPAKHVPVNSATGMSTASGRIFNGRDFWQRLSEVRTCLKQAARDCKYSENAIVIVGAGGTAAAILAWLVSNGASDLPIQMVANQAALYTRVDSDFENQLFSDETQWATVIDRVSSASKFKMVDGRAQQIVISGATDVQLEVLRGDDQAVTLHASMLIDCSGFDAWWFLSLIDALSGVAPQAEGKRREAWQQKMGENLRLQGTPWNAYPPLHAPMLSRELGPGFGSLMVLGAMADRVLRTYSLETQSLSTP